LRFLWMPLFTSLSFIVFVFRFPCSRRLGRSGQPSLTGFYPLAMPLALPLHILCLLTAAFNQTAIRLSSRKTTRH
jgi:hypothetical protein